MQGLLWVRPNRRQADGQQEVWGGECPGPERTSSPFLSIHTARRGGLQASCVNQPWDAPPRKPLLKQTRGGAVPPRTPLRGRLEPPAPLPSPGALARQLLPGPGGENRSLLEGAVLLSL